MAGGFVELVEGFDGFGHAWLQLEGLGVHGSGLVVGLLVLVADPQVEVRVGVVAVQTNRFQELVLRCGVVLTGGGFVGGGGGGRVVGGR